MKIIAIYFLSIFTYCCFRSILQTEGILPQTAAHSYHRQLLTCTFPRVHTEGRYMSILNKTKQIFTQATVSDKLLR